VELGGIEPAQRDLEVRDALQAVGEVGDVLELAWLRSWASATCRMLPMRWAVTSARRTSRAYRR
jgi:hypothetical protein